MCQKRKKSFFSNHVSLIFCISFSIKGRDLKFSGRTLWYLKNLFAKKNYKKCNTLVTITYYIFFFQKRRHCIAMFSFLWKIAWKRLKRSKNTDGTYFQGASGNDGKSSQGKVKTYLVSQSIEPYLYGILYIWGWNFGTFPSD